MSDWKFYRKHRFAKERPVDWPDDVFAISTEGLNLFGIHQRTGRLYWDGKELVTKRVLRLGKMETWIACLAAIGTFGVFTIELGKLVKWW